MKKSSVHTILTAFMSHNEITAFDQYVNVLLETVPVNDTTK